MRSITQRLWSSYSSVYDALLLFWPYVNLLQQTVTALDLKHGHHVLDLGCGTGNVLAAMHRQANITAVGIDSSPEMIELASTKLRNFADKGKLSLIETDILDYLRNQQDDTFDRVSSVNVLYAIPEQRELWEQIARVTKPGGLVAATTSVSRKNWPIILEHVENASVRNLFRPQLLKVFAIDCAIGLLGLRKTFPFPSEPQLRSAAEKAGGLWGGSKRCYGGVDHGVNTLFTVRIP